MCVPYAQGGQYKTRARTQKKTDIRRERERESESRIKHLSHLPLKQIKKCIEKHGSCGQSCPNSSVNAFTVQADDT